MSDGDTAQDLTGRTQLPFDADFERNAIGGALRRSVGRASPREIIS